MKDLTRRRLITTGVAATAGIAGLTAADRIAKVIEVAGERGSW